VQKVTTLLRIIVVYLISVFFILGVFFAFSLVPFKNNYKIVVITSGSMGRYLPEGSLAIIIPRSTYQENDLITYFDKSQKNLITHRLIKIDNDIFVTKGDNNKFNDGIKIIKEDITGKVIFSIPHIGKPILYAKTLPGLIFIVIIPGTIIIYEEIKKIISVIKTKLQINSSTTANTPN